MISDNETQTVTLRLLERHDPHQRRRGASDYQTDFETYDVNLDLRESLAGPADEAGRPERDDPARAAVRRIDAKRADGESAAPRAGRVPPQVRHPLRLRRLRPGRRSRSASQPARAVRVARLRGQPGRDLHLLHPAVRRAGTRRAGHACPPWFGLWLPNLVFGCARRHAAAPGGAGARALRHLASPISPRTCAARAGAPPRRRAAMRMTRAGAPLAAADPRRGTSASSSCARSASPCWRSSPSTCSPTSSTASTASSQHDASRGRHRCGCSCTASR